ncbi:hypothetical protein Bca4012_079356 [Brassica carinata]|uniref:Transmembrane protein n=1 Tax=Brassica carinata TaxID=52824 RepID=A0A8X7NXC8_BRACI|nr:hypothetical protein Bca52824_091562 [Brassica carinata]
MEDNEEDESWKSSSRSTQAFTVIILLLMVIMILLGLGILSGGDEEGNGERWVEVISWEPRAVVYHNFLNLFDFVIP